MDCQYYAYLICGRPEFWDLQEMGVTWACLNTNDVRNSQSPFAYVDYGNAIWGAGEVRRAAWDLREIFLAAIVAPGSRDGSSSPATGGRNVTAYYRDWAQKICKYHCDMMDPTVKGSLANKSPYYGSSSYWNLCVWDGGTFNISPTDGFQHAYMLQVVLLLVGVFAVPGPKKVSIPESASFANFMLGDKLHKLLTMGPWAMCGYYTRNQTWAGANGRSDTPPVEALFGHYGDAQCGQMGMHNSSLSFTSKTFGGTPATHFKQEVWEPYAMHDRDGLFFDSRIYSHNSLLGLPAAGHAGDYYIWDVIKIATRTDSNNGKTIATYAFNMYSSLEPQPPNPAHAIMPQGVGDLGSITPYGVMYWHPYTYPGDTTPGVQGNATMLDHIRDWWFCFNFAKYLASAHAAQYGSSQILIDNRIVTSIRNMYSTSAGGNWPIDRDLGIGTDEGGSTGYDSYNGSKRAISPNYPKP
jgi:hypothetical protein